MLPNDVPDVISLALPAQPSSPRLSLEPTGSGSGALNGAWWPRSRDPRSELPDLIASLTDRLGVVLRVSLAMEAWDDLPRQITVGDRTVKVDWFPGADQTIGVTLGSQDHRAFLVVPPQTNHDVAAAAMAMATQTANRATPAEILTASSRVTGLQLALVPTPHAACDATSLAARLTPGEHGDLHAVAAGVAASIPDSPSALDGDPMVRR